MPKGISLGIASETKAFKDGVDLGIIAPLDNAVQKLDELGKSRGPEQLDKALTDAQSDTKTLARETAKTADTIEREYKTAYASADQHGEVQYNGAIKRLTKFRESAKGNLIGLVSAFDGTSTSFIGGVESALGNVALGIGGAVGAAVAGLLVIGNTVGGQISAGIDKEAKASEDRIKSMYDNFLESGQDYFTAQQIQEATQAITGDPDKLKTAIADAKLLGTTVQEVILAEVSAGTERNELLQKAEDLRVAALEAGKSGEEIDSHRVRSLLDQIEHYRTLNGEQNDAASAAAIQLSLNEQITGEAKATNEELQIRNRRLAETPAEVSTKLVVDDSDLTSKLNRSRAIQVTIEGYTRAGQRVI